MAEREYCIAITYVYLSELAKKGVKRKKQLIWKSGSNRSNPSRRAKEGSQEPRIGNPEVGVGKEETRLSLIHSLD